MGQERILITGGAGFIGAQLVRQWLLADKNVRIVNLDKLTYCGDLSRLKDVEGDPRYTFIRGDICDGAAVEKAIAGCTGVVHAAAETHVDRSLLSAKEFFDTNVFGTYVLLEAALKAGIKRFVHVSTDEVYGSRAKGFFKESDAFAPTSPYSVSKAAADMLALSYAHTRGLSVVVTRGANTFGPYQYPEKVIPLFVSNALADKPLPLYGDGKQVRNWLPVEDHCRAIMTVYKKGKAGEAYNISTPYELQNIDLTRRILKNLGKSASLIQRVADRVGHDRRYAIDPSKLKRLGWKASPNFDARLRETVHWYKENESWWKAIKERSKDFQSYYAKAYAGR